LLFFFAPLKANLPAFKKFYIAHKFQFIAFKSIICFPFSKVKIREIKLVKGKFEIGMGHIGEVTKMFKRSTGL
jgi:hypothetical protein